MPSSYLELNSPSPPYRMGNLAWSHCWAGRGCSRRLSINCLWSYEWYSKRDDTSSRGAVRAQYWIRPKEKDCCKIWNATCLCGRRAISSAICCISCCLADKKLSRNPREPRTGVFRTAKSYPVTILTPRA